MMEAQFSRLGLEATRIEAVDGQNLPRELQPYFTIDSRPPLMKPGEIGCYASHLKTFQLLTDAGIGAALVLEDDVVLSSDLNAVIRDLVANLPSGWDMVHLCLKPDRAVKPLMRLPSCRRTLVRHSRIPAETAGYLISAAGARKMLNPDIPRIWPIDWDTRRPWVFGMDVYGLLEPPIMQDRNISSTIGRSGGRSRLRSGLPRSTPYSPTNNPLRTPEGLVFNFRKLGLFWWTRCFGINSGRKMSALMRPLARSLRLQSAIPHH